ncbi:CE-family protein, partial [Mycobacterium mantenii]
MAGSPVQINDSREPPYKFITLIVLAVLAVIFSLVYVQFRGGFTEKTELTMLAARAGLVMDPGSKVTYNGV